MTHIGPTPPEDGHDYEPRCARCGATMILHRLIRWNGEVEFPLLCDGPPKMCEAHPLPGRDHIRRGEVEWVVTERM